MTKTLSQVEFQNKIKALAAKLHMMLLPPTANVSYELIGVGKLGMKIATDLQNHLSALWQNPIGLSIIVPILKKDAKTVWRYTPVECNPKFHARKILVDAIIYTGRTCKELMELYPDAKFATLYQSKDVPEAYSVEKIYEDVKINFPNLTEER